MKKTWICFLTSLLLVGCNPTIIVNPPASPVPVVSPQSSPSAGPSESPSPVITPSDSPSADPSPVESDSPVPVAPSASPSPVVTPSVSVIPSPVVAPSPSPVVSPSPIPTITASPSPVASVVASPSPSPSPSYAILGPKLVSPAAGSTLNAFTQTFVLSAPNSSMCYVYIGSTQGSASIDSINVPSCSGPFTSNKIPANSTIIWMRVFVAYPNGQSAGGVDFSFKESGPLPLPSPSSSGTCATIGTVTGMPYCPYAPNSPWNQALPVNPTLNANSAAMIAGVLGNYTWNGVFSIDSPSSPGAFPFAWRGQSDPTVTIKETATYGKLNGLTIPMVEFPTPAPLPDAHFSVLDASNGNDYEMFNFPTLSVVNQGEIITIGAGSIMNYQTGSGWGGVTTASGAGLLGGLVTVDEFMSGVIHHALAIAPACNNGYPYGSLPNVPPATSNAAYTCPSTPKAPGIAHGSRIWSDLTPAQVAALNLDKISSIVLVALNQYGAYVTDTNGWIGLDIRNIMEAPVSQDGMIWWNQNGGLAPSVPMLNKQPVSFFTAHLHVLDPCVNQGTCSASVPRKKLGRMTKMSFK